MKEARKYIYISHPFSANPKANREMARMLTGLLARSCGINNFIFINPLDLFMGQSLTFEQDRWILSQAIEVMLKCDGVIFCYGWEKSKGCRMEHRAAWKAGLPRWLGIQAFIDSFDPQEEVSERLEMLMFHRGLLSEDEMRRRQAI